MAEVGSSDVLFFFGAGASAPFGIPTMKQFVIDFEEHLKENATKDELITYTEIKEILEKRLSKQVDLEGVFTVIDGIINYGPERLGLLSLYSAIKFKKEFPNKLDIKICKKLRKEFQTFIREKCIIPDESFAKINMVYQDFFNRIAIELGHGYSRKEDYSWNSNWSIFTTNYDTCLEYYWREVARVGIDTGFEHSRERNVNTLNSRKFLIEDSGVIQLFKLHGSVSWRVEEGTDEVIEEMERGRSLLGRRYVGEMMLYPIAEKELYLNPYISMLLRLNRELERRAVWIVIGYSFNDPVIREIFLRNSTRRTHLILVHPKAKDVYSCWLQGANGKSSLMEKKFGLEKDILREEVKEEEYRKVHHQIIHKLKDTPRFEWFVEPR